MKELHGKVAGVLPEIDYDKELSLWNTVINANKKGLLASAKDCSSGGLAVVIGKIAAVINIGANI